MVDNVGTMTSKTSMPVPKEPANNDEVSLEQSMLLSDSLKNLRKQLYAAAEYFELSYTNDDQKQTVANSLKDYAINALVNTVDHLGSVTYKVNDLLDEKVDEVSGTEIWVSCIEQRLRTCQEYIDREGLSQQSLVINTPKYHKRYILPVGETMQSAICSESKYQGCSLENEDVWLQFRHAIRATVRETPSTVSKLHFPPPSSKPALQPGKFLSSGSVARKDLEKRPASPLRFPLLRSGSFSSKSTTPKGSRPSTPNSSRPTTPNPALGRQQYFSDPRKSASMRVRVEKENPKDDEHYPSKSKRLLKALLSRHKSKKDDMLYTYLDEY
ncbi:Hypothetical predicted protein [Olea europaea subsp. europaea]|uniref:Protein ABIL2 n=1 Tax=Olea europaea subsp. europaea TaxID=158383 RepID=A0A8S0Q0H3_OLEEU|nr:Hypothetical predicted protein [Olea europaea subsp. europaea]